MEASMSEVFDWKKDLKGIYFPKNEVAEVTVPKMKYLMIDGSGDPNTSADFQKAVEALYALSYTIRFNIKKAGGTVYSVFPLEGLWWADDMNEFTNNFDDKSNWKWTLMIAQPDFVTAEKVEECREVALKKRSNPSLPSVRFEEYEEGTVAQLMHIGPYSAEGPNIQKIHKYIEGVGGKLNLKHHEIYLSDQRRVAPEKLKTVLRQPFKNSQ
jgi:hypothetical protein